MVLEIVSFLRAGDRSSTNSPQVENNITLDRDTHIYGYVESSYVSHPEMIEGRPKPIYWIEIRYEGHADAFRLGCAYDTWLGPDCANREEVVAGLIESETIRLESIHQPMISGQDELTEEFSRGQKVKVSCAFRIKEGERKMDGSGEVFKFPHFELRFVDSAELDKPPADSETEEEVWTDVNGIYYDF